MKTAEPFGLSTRRAWATISRIMACQSCSDILPYSRSTQMMASMLPAASFFIKLPARNASLRLPKLVGHHPSKLPLT